jgi:translation initiation factor IF-2
MANKLVGKITHYFDKISVAVLQVTDGPVKSGDTILVGEEGVGFTQPVDSMQVEHQQVTEAKSGDEVGLKVIQPTQKGDNVYKVEA